jgi:GrpB-like predicted nucleotidyltransferase (UPF0157 family)
MRIIILPYDQNWPTLYEEEKARLQPALMGHAIGVQHIGSTSVPGLAAKPIIDILVGARSLAEVDGFCIQPMIGLGYEYCPEFEDKTPQRRFFRRETPEGVRTHHVHLVEINSPWWLDHLLFRDTLRSNAQVRRDYEALKRRLAEREWESSQEYTEAKTEFILSALQEARAWREGVCYC